MTTPKLLAFAGSLRRDSFNKKLVKIAAAGAEAAGAKVTYVDLKDYPMPIYDQDWFDQHGFPESVLQLKGLMKDHHGFLIASPEYNSSISGALKNMIDWTSRPEEGEAPLSLTCFKGKTAAIMATSPGGLGGLRGLNHVRSILENIGVLVIPDQKAIPGAYQAFDEAGNLVDEKTHDAIASIAAKLADVTAKLQTA
ncbi:NADPH-dependent quinone reductase ArsH [Halomicronema hongdechloris C2206]|uniref:NADPH-dependent quinone reductase ArsH n=1 Tax=Halomicronema hongdechloris C2206 TaxID=1641165 RepID=A0A1Z3HVH9_9CYAN|nr:NAD(P)H-dependent oxidoreductase [Halomicronema hongdechloris]ASC74147.1 NADPH-dependent quinone reductase ArsH [Halomicronema hongdechloris C2206]